MTDDPPVPNPDIWIPPVIPRIEEVMEPRETGEAFAPTSWSPEIAEQTHQRPPRGRGIRS